MTHEFLKTKPEIAAWLDKYKIKNYTIFKDAQYGYAVNVESAIDLSYKMLSFIPVKFAMITGSFHCGHNKLISLEFCPKDIGGEFDCSYNNLVSLEYCPEIVHRDFYCSFNDIKSLAFCPQKVGGRFYCFGNKELGKAQDIKSFNQIFSIHTDDLIKKEKEKLTQELSQTQPTPINSPALFKI